MAQLNSPGVSVTVVDESFYTPGAPGTVPLIVVASQANKQNSAGTGIAPGTLAANAGIPYLLTSQADLGATFGIPYFQTDASNNPINGSEINEYGLQAAYSFLGVSNRAYVVRANLDTSQLIGTSTIPTGNPADGTYWFDTTDTTFGVFQWNSSSGSTATGQTFTNQTPLVITNPAQVNTGAPIASIGTVGQYAIVATTTLITLWLKKYATSTPAGTWVQVGTGAWAASWPTATSGTSTPYVVGSADTIQINGNTVTTTGTTQASMATAINASSALTALGITASSSNNILYIYSTGVQVTITAGLTHNGLTNSGIGGIWMAPQFTISPYTGIPTYGMYQNGGTVQGAPTGSVWVKASPVNQGANWFVKKYSAAANTWVTLPVQMFPNGQSALATLDPTGGGYNIAAGAVYVKYNETEVSPQLGNFKIHERLSSGALNITSNTITTGTITSGSNTFTMGVSTAGSIALSTISVSFTGAGLSSDAATIAAAILTASAGYPINAVVNSNNTITITHTQGGDIHFADGTATPIGKLFSTSTTTNFYADPNPAYTYVASLWTSSATSIAAASSTPPTTTPANGTLWYDSSITDVDIMINNGSAWVGYANYNQTLNGASGVTDINGPIISATQPTQQSTGAALANGDIWVSTANLELFPQIYVYNFLTKVWVLVNNADHTSGNGIVFADARWSTSGASSGTPATIAALLASNFLDPDAPSYALYPRGTLLYNLRRSGFNVKKYVSGYINTANGYNANAGGESMAGYFADRWVSDAANDTNGVGRFGSHAQRQVVLQALEATIQSNQQIRQPDTVIFNLLSCPGYIETLSSLVGLNNDNGLSAFIVADSPIHLNPTATALSNWGNNTAGAVQDNWQGLVTTDPYSAVYYPWGFTTDLLGNDIVVPPSYIMLRTIALSDNVSYPWFAPAGVRRGGVTNASSVGYVDSQTGEYQTVALNQGQRDTLASVHVNPITYLAGTGLVCYGQYTRQLAASSLDRINVARLVIYLRYQLNVIAKPFIFEPNDTITRNEIKQQIEKLLLQLTGERALYDYIVVCDKSNNTPARIDANELHVDIAIEPVKSVEFIYIPLRLENTGAIAGLSGA
jgi:Phage tail sheath C-terminal domain